MRKIHPGEVLREEFCIPKMMNTETLAEKMGVDYKVARRLMIEQQEITPVLAEKLAKVFDTSAEFWLALQSSFERL